MASGVSLRMARALWLLRKGELVRPYGDAFENGEHVDTGTLQALERRGFTSSRLLEGESGEEAAVHAITESGQSFLDGSVFLRVVKKSCLT